MTRPTQISLNCKTYAVKRTTAKRPTMPRPLVFSCTTSEFKCLTPKAGSRTAPVCYNTAVAVLGLLRRKHQAWPIMAAAVTSVLVGAVKCDWQWRYQTCYFFDFAGPIGRDVPTHYLAVFKC